MLYWMRETNSKDALIANWGGFTHTSVAIRDALELLTIPKVEVHLVKYSRPRGISGDAQSQAK